MSEIIAIFRMTELSAETRIRVIKALGKALNYQFAANWTGEIVDELVGILESTPTSNLREGEDG